MVKGSSESVQERKGRLVRRIEEVTKLLKDESPRMSEEVTAAWYAKLETLRSELATIGGS